MRKNWIIKGSFRKQIVSVSGLPGGRAKGGGGVNTYRFETASLPTSSINR